MIKNIDIKQNKGTINLIINASHPIVLIVEVINPNKKDTVYIKKRYKVAVRNKKIFLRLPQCSDVVQLKIYREGYNPGVDDHSFNVSELKILPLKTNYLIYELRKTRTRQFLKFAQWFSENASILSTGVYKENDFRINYVDDVVDRKTNKKMNTPGRISATNGNIDIARNKFLAYTIPQRMAILLHEYCHVYMNSDMSDEFEADLRMARIMLGAGYPYSDILKVFLVVFWGAKTPQNIERYNRLEKIFEDFQNKRHNYVTNFYFWE
jgi:hypothetical protein